MHMYTCFVCVYRCVYIYIYTCTFMYTNIYLLFTYIYIYTYIHVHVGLRARAYSVPAELTFTYISSIRIYLFCAWFTFIITPKRSHSYVHMLATGGLASAQPFRSSNESLINIWWKFIIHYRLSNYGLWFQPLEAATDIGSSKTHQVENLEGGKNLTMRGPRTQQGHFRVALSGNVQVTNALRFTQTSRTGGTESLWFPQNTEETHALFQPNISKHCIPMYFSCPICMNWGILCTLATWHSEAPSAGCTWAPSVAQLVLFRRLFGLEKLKFEIVWVQ